MTPLQIFLLVLGVALGVWFVVLVIRQAVKQNDFSIVLMLIIGFVALITAL